MNCKICSALFQEYLDKTLSEELIYELENHLKICEQCNVFFKTYCLTVTLSRKIETPCCVSTEMMQRLTTLLHERLFPK